MTPRVTSLQNAHMFPKLPAVGLSDSRSHRTYSIVTRSSVPRCWENLRRVMCLCPYFSSRAVARLHGGSSPTHARRRHVVSQTRRATQIKRAVVILSRCSSRRSVGKRPSAVLNSTTSIPASSHSLRSLLIIWPHDCNTVRS